MALALLLSFKRSESTAVGRGDLNLFRFFSSYLLMSGGLSCDNMSRVVAIKS